jgi:hypothetical protein
MIAVDRDFLNRMEDGGQKNPTKGRWLWKPNAAVFKEKIISRSNPLHPHNLKFTGNNKRGPLRTFMANNNGRTGGPLILQRTGAASTGHDHTDQLRTVEGRFDGQLRRLGQRKRKQGVRMLYQLVARTRVPRKLEFINTLTRSARANFDAEMVKAMTEAVRSAK